MVEVEEVPPRKRRKGCWIATAIVGLLLICAGVFYGPTLRDFWKVYGPVLGPVERHAYRAGSEENLKAIYQGLMLYHESEGQFPNANNWMDAIKNRIKTNDLIRGEAEKKLVRPDLLGQADQFGYAMNDSVAGKYKDDISDPDHTPLIFESKSKVRNAHGDPKSERTGLAISVSGKVLTEQ